jgi:hypothetical protein
MKKLLFVVIFSTLGTFCFANETNEKNTNDESTYQLAGNVDVVTHEIDLDYECCATITASGEYPDGTKWVRSWTACSNNGCAEAVSMLVLMYNQDIKSL